MDNKDEAIGIVLGLALSSIFSAVSYGVVQHITTKDQREYFKAKTKALKAES